MPALPASFTIRLDATGREYAWVITGDGQRLDLWWQKGFVGGPPDDPTVRDPGGNVVARDGEIVVPGQANDALHGHALCAPEGSLYVMLDGP
jgi:hypothetical protein